VYGGQTWGKTVVPHELKREEYYRICVVVQATVVPHELKREECYRIWVAVQATDKACAARGAS
jgi:hypothetical protein